MLGLEIKVVRFESDKKGLCGFPTRFGSLLLLESSVKVLHSMVSSMCQDSKTSPHTVQMVSPDRLSRMISVRFLHSKQ